MGWEKISVHSISKVLCNVSPENRDTSTLFYFQWAHTSMDHQSAELKFSSMSQNEINLYGKQIPFQPSRVLFKVNLLFFFFYKEIFIYVHSVWLPCHFHGKKNVILACDSILNKVKFINIIQLPWTTYIVIGPISRHYY